MKFHDSLPNYDWDQMLPIGVTTEQLYQAFKARLMRELHTDGGEWIYDNAAGKMVRKTARPVDTAYATAWRG